MIDDRKDGLIVHRSSLLDRRDWLTIAVCAVVFGVSLYFVLKLFPKAFPEASIEMRYDRAASRDIAERVAGNAVRGMKHAAVFDADNTAKIFLERSLGLERANAVVRENVRVWYWRHRWFQPLQEEEWRVDVAPTGEIVGFTHTIPEARALPVPSLADARRIAEEFLKANGIRVDGDATQSERKLPNRVQRIFTWDSKAIRPAGAPLRTTVVVDGNVVGDYSQRLRVPDEWQRQYRELRSKNLLAGNVDRIFLGITMIAALGVFIVRLRRGDLRLRFLLAIGAASVVLSAAVAINEWPLALASYDTTSSYAAFLLQFAIWNILLNSIGAAMLLIVICGAGEVLYRERLPQHLALPRLWTPRALASKRVFRSLVIGYAMVPLFVLYQAVFYIAASRFGAWSPADIPYDDMLNTALPWAAVLFAGFFPSLSEEFLSRAFSIPFFQKVLRSRVLAIVIAGVIWGFGHATYPNQPFYIRGLEVGLAGIALGFAMDRWGLLPLLIWHYTIDAVYTALLLFRSGNPYYVVSAAAASLIFAFPLFASIALYLRNRGFVPDDDLTNASMPLAPVPEPTPEPPPPPLPPPTPLTRWRLMAFLAAIAAAVALVMLRPPSPNDAVDYRITRDEAKALAKPHVSHRAEKIIATPLAGFRSWNRESPREDGGAPTRFDRVAAEYLAARGADLIDVFRNRVPAGTWSVRAFAPMQKEETFVEVDPRRARVVGYHKYQDEKNRGPRLDQVAALAIAQGAFARYGADARAFELKEALSFHQPNRLDWLFHFQERRPIAGEGFRRITVRVAGAEVTQFTSTVKVPDAVYREANRQTVMTVVLIVLKIAGAVTALSLVIGGAVAAMMRRKPRWSVAMKWAMAFVVVAVGSVVAAYESSLFGYSTSVQWQTFTANELVNAVGAVGLRLGLVFLAVAAITSTFPVEVPPPRRHTAAEAAAAPLRALAAVSLLVAASIPFQSLDASVDISEAVAIPLPALLALGESLYWAVLGAGAAAAFAVALQGMKRRRLRDVTILLVAFCASVDVGATAPQMPLMLLRTAVLALVVWLIARFVLGDDLLAWPLAIFTGAMLLQASELLRHDRGDLKANAIALMVVLVVALIPWRRVRHA